LALPVHTLDKSRVFLFLSAIFHAQDGSMLKRCSKGIPGYGWSATEMDHRGKAWPRWKWFFVPFPDLGPREEQALPISNVGHAHGFGHLPGLDGGEGDTHPAGRDLEACTQVFPRDQVTARDNFFDGLEEDSLGIRDSGHQLIRRILARRTGSLNDLPPVVVAFVPIPYLMPIEQEATPILDVRHAGYLPGQDGAIGEPQASGAGRFDLSCIMPTSRRLGRRWMDQRR